MLIVIAPEPFVTTDVKSDADVTITVTVEIAMICSLVPDGTPHAICTAVVNTLGVPVL